ncbi:MAG: helix-turn-helix domain-containing protein [Candidatus Buchananbacteria bacterium]
MYIEVLNNIGLSTNEARIYNALLELKVGTVSAISRHAGIDRRNVYDTIHRLIKQGLVYQIMPRKTLTYAPVSPEKLREFVEEKVKELETALPGMLKKFDLVSPIQQISIFKGIRGLKSYINLILKTGQDVYGLGSKGSWFDPRVRNFSIRACQEWKKKKIKGKYIYDAEIKNHPEVMKWIGGAYKFLPKKYSSNSSLEIFGDYVVIYSGMSPKELDDDISFFVLRDKTLARDYLKWFELIWDLLPAVNKKPTC